MSDKKYYKWDMRCNAEGVVAVYWNDGWIPYFSKGYTGDNIPDFEPCEDMNNEHYRKLIRNWKELGRKGFRVVSYDEDGNKIIKAIS